VDRLSEKQSKHHICDALDTISSFCKLQKKKMVLRAEKKKKAASTSSAHHHHHHPLPPPGGPVYSIPRGMGGLEDVD
jgi:hypothetical protein